MRGGERFRHGCRRAWLSVDSIVPLEGITMSRPLSGYDARHYTTVDVAAGYGE